MQSTMVPCMVALVAVVALLINPADATFAFCKPNQISWGYGSGKIGCRCKSLRAILGGDGECKECDGKSRCNQYQNKCESCGEGKYYDEKSQDCKGCDNGEEYDDNEKSCKPKGPKDCGKTSISVGGGTSCWPCEGTSYPANSPNGQYCACDWGVYDYNNKYCICKDSEIYVRNGCWECKEGFADRKDNLCKCTSGAPYNYSARNCSPVKECTTVANANNDCSCKEGTQLNMDGNRCVPKCRYEGQVPLGHFGEKGCVCKEGYELKEGKCDDNRRGSRDGRPDDSSNSSPDDNSNSSPDDSSNSSPDDNSNSSPDDNSNSSPDSSKTY